MSLLGDEQFVLLTSRVGSSVSLPVVRPLDRRERTFLMRIRPSVPMFGLLVLSMLTACGGSYQPSRSSNFQIDAEAEIDDDDIRKAFDARPQMPASNIRLSYYTFDPNIADDLDKTMSTVPGVTSTYRIPPLLVTGQRRYQENNGYYGQTSDVSVKKLRLLAARAKTDILVIVDHGYRNEGVNPLVALNVLIVPILFVPFINTVIKGYVEAFVVDVRNGYLYGHLVQEDERGETYTTIYGTKFDVYAAAQWKDLRLRFGKDLSALIEKERTLDKQAQNPPAVAPATTSAPPSTATPPYTQAYFFVLDFVGLSGSTAVLHHRKPVE
jgi:hypothetical protein